MDHFLVWMELGRITNRSRKEKRVIKRWLDTFTNEEVKLRYQEAGITRLRIRLV